MKQNITEEMGVQNEWYAEAKGMTLEKLPDFLKKLTEDFGQDYGTICHAIAAAAIGAAWSVEHSPQGGITGFQGGAVMWQFITNWMSEYKDKPVRLVDYSNMLFPQYADKFGRSISKETHQYLVKEAQKKLSDSDGAHPNVKRHWEMIAAGGVPFGYAVSDAD
jgi:hypothetical protein